MEDHSNQDEDQKKPNVAYTFLQQSEESNHLFSSFPDLVVDEICSYLQKKDLMNLRLTTKTTKGWVDNSPSASKNLISYQFILDEKTLPRFLREVKTFPASNFRLNFSSVLFFDLPIFQTFLLDFSSKILKLSVKSMFKCQVDSEFEFYESLTNLRELSIDGFFQATENIPPGDKLKSIQDYIEATQRTGWGNERIPIDCLERLNRLEIKEADEDSTYHWILIRSCFKVKYLQIPKLKDLDPLVRFFNSMSELERIIEYILLRTQNNENKPWDSVKIKIIDLQDLFNCVLSSGIENEPQQQLPMRFIKLIQENDIYLRNVSVHIMNEIFRSYGEQVLISFSPHVLSLVGMSFRCDSSTMVNVDEFYFDASNVSGNRFTLQYLDLDWPKLRKISGKLNCCTIVSNLNLNQIFETKNAIKRIFRLIFKSGIRDQVKEIEMEIHGGDYHSFVVQTYYTYPMMEMKDLVENFPNLKRLKLDLIRFPKEALINFWDVLSKTNVERLELNLSQSEFDDEVFIGPDSSQPVLLQLKNLKHLKIESDLPPSGICVSDRIFAEVFSLMELESLVCLGNGFDRVTPDGLLWLGEGIVGHTIKRFEFKHEFFPSSDELKRLAKANRIQTPSY